MAGKINPVIRPMQYSDINQAMDLVHAANWNQTRKDWDFFLENSGINLAVEINQKIIGTITTNDYKAFVWIAMVLVHPEFRRKGIATLMMDKILDFYSDRILCLDATPEGAQVYDQFGFKPVKNLARWHRVANPSFHTSFQWHNIKSTEKINDIIEYDKEIFGADRAMILQQLVQFYPERAIALDTNNFVFGRDGRIAKQIGPLVACGEALARKLIEINLTSFPEDDFFLDAFCDPNWNRILRDLGFEKQREFIRMQKGSSELFGQYTEQFAIAGPELG